MIRSPRILIVDDEPRICHSMKNLLSTQDYDVQTCFNGNDALGFLRQETFDLVLLDIFMEGMDGFQVIENKINQKIDTPVIIMTGVSSTDTAIKALRMGAIDYLKKPFGTQEMFLSIEKGLSKRKLEKKRRSDERQTAQRQKSESLGRMAGSIAHHFNNQLSAVMGNLEIALEDVPLDAGYRKNLFQAMMAAHKAAAVSRQMLIYFGHALGRYMPVDLPESSRKTLSILTSAIPEGMNLVIDFPDSGPVIHADPILIQQVLANLITNAWESISNNQGSIGLTIRTVDQVSTTNHFPIDWQPQNVPHACLEVSDTGCGISGIDIGKLFDPFFTTKFTGRGMGLPVVMGIVKAHNGCITVDSEPGRGSTFRIYIPISTEKITLPLDQEKPTKVPTRKVENRGTVLLIEDEEMVRNMAKAMLIRLGYAVIEAQDGVEAVRLFQEHQNEIDCVLSDLTMPRMNGWETLTALREKGADVPVILASGYDENTVMAGDHPELPQAFLNKPYSMAALKDVLLEAIRL